jgi:hypothetical protein
VRERKNKNTHLAAAGLAVRKDAHVEAVEERRDEGPHVLEHFFLRPGRLEDLVELEARLGQAVLVHHDVVGRGVLRHVFGLAALELRAHHGPRPGKDPDVACGRSADTTDIK